MPQRIIRAEVKRGRVLATNALLNAAESEKKFLIMAERALRDAFDCPCSVTLAETERFHSEGLTPAEIVWARGILQAIRDCGDWFVFDAE